MENKEKISELLLPKNRCMCDSCLDTIMFKLKKEDILILNVLKKSKCINKHCTFDKMRLLNEVKSGLTDFKINMCFERLEITSLMEHVVSGRTNRYYITKDGLKLLDIYMKEIQADMQSVK